MKVFKEKFGKKIRLTSERESHIKKRPEMKNQLRKIAQTLKEPDLIKESNYDKETLLYYKCYDKTPVTKKHLLVAIKSTESPFVITAFFTDKIKTGKTIFK